MPFKDPNLPENIESARAYRRKHYASNREQYYERNRKTREAKKAYIDELRDVPCADCGNRFPPEAMDFDHVRGTKVQSVTRLVSSSWRLLREEIPKCEVVCARCHRIRTKKRLIGV